MNSSASGRVLHLVPPNGGGVDRFVRDLCAHRPADWLLHVSDEQCVVECPDAGLLIPVAFTELSGLIARGALGRAAALHAHSTVPAMRQVTSLLTAGMELPYVITLHDVEFAGAAGSPDPIERAQRCDFIRAAAACTVPSQFMRGVALEVLGASFACTVVENGIERLTPAATAPGPERFPIAVIGAMGKHKGLDHLIEVGAHLPAGLRIVLLGYADGQLGPGWLVDGKIWVHGAFEPTQLPNLVAEYAAAVAFFPKGQPESYCYALSDAWLAALPVVGPDSGAIGERVRAHGGGSLYDPDASAEDVARLIARQLDQSESVRANVEGAAQSLTSIASMVESMNNIYSPIAAPASPPDLDALKRSASKHLDSRFFRQELLRLQGDLAAAGEQRDSALRELHSLAENFRKRGDWIDHLQQAHDSLQQECWNLQKSGEDMRQELEQLQLRLTGFEALQAEHAQLLGSYGALKTRHETLVRRLKWPLRLLPAPVQSWLVKTARRIFVEARNG